LSRLQLKGLKVAVIALRLEHIERSGNPEGADQLILEIETTNEEPKALHSHPIHIDAATGLFQSALEIPLFANVAQANDLEAGRTGTRSIEHAQISADAHRAADRDDAHAIGVECAAASGRQRLDRNPVAHSFDQYDRSQACRLHELTSDGRVPSP
jgi:hypothetical protein